MAAAAHRPRSLVLLAFFTVVFFCCKYQQPHYAALFVSASPTEHPLNQITLTELIDLRRVVNASQSHLCSNASLVFHYLGLEEPDKTALLSYLSGSTKFPPPRRGLAVIRCQNRTQAVTVDLATHTVASVNDHPGSGFPLLAYYDDMKVIKLLQSYPPFLASVARRGLDLQYVLCGPVGAGWDGQRGVGRRLLRIFCSYEKDVVSPYFKPIEGITAVADPDAMVLVHYVDTGAQPVPSAAGAEYRATAQKEAPPGRKGGEAVPDRDGRGYEVDGHIVRG